MQQDNSQQKISPLPPSSDSNFWLGDVNIIDSLEHEEITWTCDFAARQLIGKSKNATVVRYFSVSDIEDKGEYAVVFNKKFDLKGVCVL